MEITWFIILVSLFIPVLLKLIFNLLSPSTTPTTTKIKDKLPPGPLNIPILSNFLWSRKTFRELEPVLRKLHAKYGPMVTLPIGSCPSIFIADRSIAHQALVQSSFVFASRPKALYSVNRLISSNQQSISLAPYGPTWRLLRRNLTSEILHPSRVKSFSPARKRAFEILTNHLNSHAESREAVPVLDNLLYALFCLLVFMCFGDEVSENQIKNIKAAQVRLLLSFNRFKILSFWPKVGKYIFHKRWEEFFRFRMSQEDVFFPLIRARKQIKEDQKLRKAEENKEDEDEDDCVLPYVDTLLDFHLPDDKRKLDEGEIVSLCSEFLNAGTETTVAAMQWTMANIVKYPHIQDKLVEEIYGVVGPEKREVTQEDLHKMPYLKAVILEGLRRHSPAHFLLPHAVTKDVILNGYLIPENATVNFMVAEMGWDPKVWQDPKEFKPERFLSSDGKELFDLTGSREIKMMPFGAGRRMCPGYDLGLLHLEYFVANMVWHFKWMAVDGDDIDLTEIQVLSVSMKYPLQANISPRLEGA